MLMHIEISISFFLKHSSAKNVCKNPNKSTFKNLNLTRKKNSGVTSTLR